MISDLNAWFWSPEIWLPRNITWEDVTENKEIEYPDNGALYYPLPLAVLFLGLRHLLEK